MTREETALIVKTLRLSYPGFYSRYKPGDFTDLIALWSTMFAEDDAEIVTEAVRELIKTHTGFPPEIADVKTKMREMVATVTGEPTDEEYWIILRRALADGIWGASEQFERLPAELKRFCGSPSWLRDHARMGEDVLDSVIHGQFLKQFPRVRERQQFHDSLPEGVRQAIARIYKPFAEDRLLDEFECNDKRNNIILQLEGSKSL